MMSRRNVMLALCFVLLALIYVSQQINYLSVILEFIAPEKNKLHPYTYFIFNKTLRFIFNDTTMVFVIWLLWKEKSYVKLALYIQAAGLFVILPIYFVAKLWLEGDAEISSPLLSFIHRLVVNPTLLIMLIPALYYQRTLSAKVNSRQEDQIQ